MVKVVVAGLATVLLGPACLMLGLGALLNPAAQAECLPSSPVVAQTPDTLTARTASGVNVTLNQTQLTRAATIVNVGAGTKGVGRDGIVIALMAALTESTLRMLSNTSAYPQSANYPNDGNGGDHDSLGLFQMRPSTGWGSVENLMDAEYQAEAFYGGPSGPNHGSPRGLLDIPDWKLLPKGAAAQAVEVSAYPDRYADYEPVAEAILDTMATGTSSGSCGDDTQGLGSSAAAWLRGRVHRRRAEGDRQTVRLGRRHLHRPLGSRVRRPRPGVRLLGTGHVRRLPSLRREAEAAALLRRPDHLRAVSRLGGQAARRPHLLHPPRLISPAPRRHLRRRRQDPPSPTHRPERALRNRLGVRRRDHDSPPPRSMTHT